MDFFFASTEVLNYLEQNMKSLKKRKNKENRNKTKNSILCLEY